MSTDLKPLSLTIASGLVGMLAIASHHSGAGREDDTTAAAASTQAAPQMRADAVIVPPASATSIVGNVVVDAAPALVAFRTMDVEQWLDALRHGDFN